MHVMGERTFTGDQTRSAIDLPTIGLAAGIYLIFGLVTWHAAALPWWLVMAAGGILNARRVAETMSRKITTMNPGQGFTANLVTSLLVAGASRLGLSVSTTHVAVGSLFGIGLVNRTTNAKMIRTILLAWVTTLPIGAALAAGLYLLLRAAQVGA